MSDVKRAMFVQLAVMGQSLASPQRIELLDYLAQAERAVEELAQLSGLSVANTSRHLQQLKQAGLVSVRKDGKSRLYTLASDEVVRLMQQLRHTAQTHLAEVERLRNTLTPALHDDTLSQMALAARLHDDELIVLDVRPAKEFACGHIAGAINIDPVQTQSTDDMVKRLRTLPKNKAIVAYCRGPFCVYAYEVVALLRQQGFNAQRLAEGFPEWKAAGLAFEQTV